MWGVLLLDEPTGTKLLNNQSILALTYKNNSSLKKSNSSLNNNNSSGSSNNSRWPPTSSSNSNKPDLLSKLRKDSKLTQQEWQWQMDSNLCLFHGKGGHVACDCSKPYPLPWRPRREPPRPMRSLTPYQPCVMIWLSSYPIDICQLLTISEILPFGTIFG